jgi:hypothetical protein
VDIGKDQEEGNWAAELPVNRVSNLTPINDGGNWNIWPGSNGRYVLPIARTLCGSWTTSPTNIRTDERATPCVENYYSDRHLGAKAEDPSSDVRTLLPSP